MPYKVRRKNMNILPYLSYSSMVLFEVNPEEWIQKYIYNKTRRPNRNMLYGSMLADAMEKEELSGDLVLNLMMSKLPKYDLADKVIEDKKNGVEVLNPHDGKKYIVPTLKNGKEYIPLLAKPDSAKSDYSAFIEYKTSTKKWTKKMVDEFGQVTFYALAMAIVNGGAERGLIPQDIEFVVVKTKYTDGGHLVPSGELWRCITTRSRLDLIKMTSRIRKAWAGIQTLVEKEVL